MSNGFTGWAGDALQPQVSEELSRVSPEAVMEAGGGLQSRQWALTGKSHAARGDSAGHPSGLVLNVVSMGTQARQADDTAWWPSSPPRDLCLFLRETSLASLALPEETPGCPRPPGTTQPLQASPPVRPLSRPSCVVILRAPVQKGA